MHMWGKSFAAFFGGCLLSILIMLHLNQFLPAAIDKRLLIGLLIALPIWGGVMLRERQYQVSMVKMSRVI